MKKYYMRYGWAVIAVLAVVILGIAMVNDETPAQRFEVIDHYKNCDVIRYTTPSSDWQYFLHCS